MNSQKKNPSIIQWLTGILLFLSIHCSAQQSQVSPPSLQQKSQINLATVSDSTRTQVEYTENESTRILDQHIIEQRKIARQKKLEST